MNMPATINDRSKEILEVITKNWDNYTTFLEKGGVPTALAMYLGTRDMPSAPASTRSDLVGSYVGGLVELSLRTMVYMVKLATVYNLGAELPRSSIIKIGLLHDIGKLGTPDGEPYYIESKDEWRRNKLGENFSINPDLQHMSVPTLTTMWLNKFNVELTANELHAVHSLGNHPGVFDRNDAPNKTETWASVVLQQSVKAAILKGRGQRFPSLVS